MADYIQIRSFLAANVEILLENLAARRQSKKNQSEDIFSDFGEEKSVSINWKKQINPKTKRQILMEEKNSLGLYVSGNPLEDYTELLKWARKTSTYNNLHLILIDKIKKIFTKSNNMMFALQVSTVDVGELEAVIFPKRAMQYSPLLEEGELYWFMARKTEPKAKKKEEVEEVQEETAETSNVEAGEEVNITVEAPKEFVEKEKLLVEHLVRFDQGLVKLFEGSELPSKQRILDNLQNLAQLDWQKLQIDPSSFQLTNPKKSTKKSSNENLEQNLEKANTSQQDLKTAISQTKIPTLKLPKTLGKKIMEISKQLRKEAFENSSEIKLEIENATGFQKVKGSLWIENNLLKQLEGFLG